MILSTDGRNNKTFALIQPSEAYQITPVEPSTELERTEGIPGWATAASVVLLVIGVAIYFSIKHYVFDIPKKEQIDKLLIKIDYIEKIRQTPPVEYIQSNASTPDEAINIARQIIRILSEIEEQLSEFESQGLIRENETVFELKEFRKSLMEDLHLHRGETIYRQPYEDILTTIFRLNGEESVVARELAIQEYSRVTGV